MKELQLMRQSSSLFTGKGFITPRDLFRWGFREPNSEQSLAEIGYMLLGERLRSDVEKEALKQVLQKCIKCSLDIESIYNNRFPADAIQKLSRYY